MNENSKVGELIEVDATGIDGKGQGLASLGERELLIPGLFPGERAKVRIEALARHAPRAHGRVHQLLRASPSRREPPCSRHEQHQRAPGDHRPKPSCGGCPLMALELDAQRDAKREWIQREYGLVLDGPIVGGDELGYRWSSKRVVGGEPGKLRLGSRAAGKRRGDHIADMHGCLVDHPRIRDGIDALERLANELGIEPWHERGRGGDLRYVWAKTNGTQLLLTLICGDERSRAALELGPRLHDFGVADGIAWSVQPSSGNAIRGGTPQLIAGLAELGSNAPDPDTGLELGPLGFLQPNPMVAGIAYRDLIEVFAAEPGRGGLPSNLFAADTPAEPGAEPLRGAAKLPPSSTLALDLYAGAGVTTRLLRARFEQVIPCESYPESAERLGVEPQTVETFTRAWLDDGRPTPALIVANPPRAGLGEAVCESLRALAAPRVHLMSCSPQSLAADLERLRGDYELVGLRGYDTLPQTAHLELVAWLSRRRQE